MYRFCAKHDQRHHPCMKSDLKPISKSIESIKTQMKNRTLGMSFYVKRQKTQTQVTFTCELFPVVINWEGSNQASITRTHVWRETNTLQGKRMKCWWIFFLQFSYTLRWLTVNINTVKLQQEAKVNKEVDQGKWPVNWDQ